jgi:hypothetical protein
MTRADLLHKSEDLPVIASALQQMRVERNEDIDPSPLPLLRALEFKRHQQGRSLSLWNVLTGVAEKFTAEDEYVIAIEKINSIDTGYEVVGTIYNAELQGSTVLAAFMEELENHAAITVITYPVFTRAQQNGQLITPFTTTLQYD